MSKATLTFDLPEESCEHLAAIHGHEYQSALWEVDRWLRGLEKYDDKLFVPIEEVRAKLREETEGLPIFE